MTIVFNTLGAIKLAAALDSRQDCLIEFVVRNTRGFDSGQAIVRDHDQCLGKAGQVKVLSKAQGWWPRDLRKRAAR